MLIVDVEKNVVMEVVSQFNRKKLLKKRKFLDVAVIMNVVMGMLVLVSGRVMILVLLQVAVLMGTHVALVSVKRKK